MKIYVLTAVHNDLEDTKKLLKSIFAQRFKDFELYLIDDGSVDGTTHFIKQNFPKVNILKGDGNLWWTASLNLGLINILRKASDDDFVWIINNDCYFDKDILKNLLVFEKKKRSRKNIIGSVVLDPKTNKVFDNGVSIDWKNLKFRSGGTDALSTKGTLYPIQVFKKVGLFDAKHFPHYFSDYDFSIRAKSCGFHLIVCPTAKIYNRIERTGIENPSLKKFDLRNIIQIIFSKKSKVNLLLQINMIRYACPKEYKLRCTFLLFAKIIRTFRI